MAVILCIFLSMNLTKYVAIVLPTIPIPSATKILIVSSSFLVISSKGLYKHEQSITTLVRL